jgi:hypothetical protein
MDILLRTPDGKIFGSKQERRRDGKKFKYCFRIGEERYYTDELDTRYFDVDENEYVLKAGLNIIWFGSEGFIKSEEPNQFWFRKIK